MSPDYIGNVLTIISATIKAPEFHNYIFIRIIYFKAVVIKNLAFDIVDKYQRQQIVEPAKECILPT